MCAQRATGCGAGWLVDGGLAVGGAGEVLPQLTVPLPKGCSPDGRGCGPLDAPGLDLARPDMEARKAS